MKARFLIEEPGEIQATMKITMPVKEWIELRDQLADKWPSFRLSQAITQVVAAARGVYYADEKDAL